MTSERRRLGVSIAATTKANAREGFAVGGARLEKLKERARDLRRNPTEAQKALWAELSGAKLGGAKFTRQAVVGSAIVDFACPSRWIVVQISDRGGNADLYALQDRKLTDVGLRVLRFGEDAVLGDLASVLEAIRQEMSKPFDRREAARANAHVPRDAEDLA